MELARATMIGLDASKAATNGTGLGTYGRVLIRGLNQLANPQEFSFLAFSSCRGRLGEVLPNDRIVLPTVQSSTRVAKWFAQDLLAPQKFDRLGVGLYHGLAHSLPWLAKVPLVVTIHDIIPWTNPELYPWLDRCLYKARISASINKADHIIAVSEFTKAQLVSRLNVDSRKVSVTYQSVREQYVLGSDEMVEKNPYFLVLGTMEERKNIRRIINAWIQLPKVFRLHYRLKFIGKGQASFMNEMMELAAQDDVPDSIEWLGYQSEEVVRDHLLRTSGLVYVPLIEGFGLPALEALSMGAPVMASRTSSLPEVVGKAGYLIDPFSIDEIRQGFLDLAQDSGRSIDERRASLSLRLKQASQFSIQETVRKTLQVYRDVLAQR